MSFILAIDQGTTSTRAILFDGEMQVAHTAQQEFPQYFPQAGWVEHDPEEIWSSTLEVCRRVIAEQGISASDITAIGITNQRETTVVWDRETGQPIHKAIVWQDRRTSAICEELRTAGHGDLVHKTTGLLLDPYFSGTKVKWILDTVPGARSRAAEGKLMFGTVDSFLIWRLTGGAAHVTDATNAARTLMYDIREGGWSAEICEVLDVPMQMLPEVKDCAADFGIAAAEHFGAEIPILGVAGDQQAATIGQACFQPGMMKSTYGTGCFALLNTGATPVESRNRMLTTIAYQLDGQPTYALEGSIFIAGAAVQWLRDGLGIIGSAQETGGLAASADPGQDVILVPAFTGLGAPYWEPDCRGGMFGLTRNSGPAEFARAALQSVAYQTRDLWEAMRADWQEAAEDSVTLRVDGGMSASDWTMQSLSDILGAPVDRPVMQETTALGAAWLAGMKAGIYPDQSGFAATWARDRQFTPAMEADQREAAYGRWKRAVQAVIGV
ncbi:glycerol kinase GlpK [Phaeobacter gallaeciensis]|uniref:glycerol kinase GlpK n=1 Tax=Phaeobacter gallaeciensis TaxID=60890 RepID=UPI00237F05D0|nr:glycerol kinase GlpK [Phaeobacter gallaeciensis]MDE4098190.1 glycerol kinase GlpK [Phaeobacter gallaeciensis]MDE4107000.1 glycerol kinase GlpK [Phaeobacter gallaeciensis]MDE4111541.1 glycerol kinase GlpK [Phaeobacter gallaeciensis]MDE4115925.1 glycerol kinase GlpK [Phaeobacter gallaeciensis]MDE4120483.1 glycerol kinase GlpK [Phaeobacter gallaeciensis]